MIVKIKRQRYGGKPYYESFLYDGGFNKTVAYVLDTLNFKDDLKDIDGKSCERIAWECSCMQKVCGACGMIINGKPSLACCSFLEKGDLLTIEPLTKFPVIEDLIVDKSIIFENLKNIQAWLEDDVEIGTEQHWQMRYDCAKCMKCGLCLEVCPNYEIGNRFFGAVVAPEAYLVREHGNTQIQKAFRTHFSAGCSKSGACELVCPAGIKTMSAIASMSGIKRSVRHPLNRHSLD